MSEVSSTNHTDNESVTSTESVRNGEYESSVDDDDEEEKLENGVSEAEIEKRKKKNYYAASEILSTEKDYVENLKLLNETFRSFINDKITENPGLIPIKDFEKVLSNLTELVIFNSDLLEDFRERLDNWETRPKIADIMVKKGRFLLLYTTYINDFSSVSNHYVDCLAKFPDFAKCVAQFEKLDICRNLKIQHFMLNPVSRLPRYKLLFQEYLKYSRDGDLDFEDAIKGILFYQFIFIK